MKKMTALRKLVGEIKQTTIKRETKLKYSITFSQSLEIMAIKKQIIILCTQTRSSKIISKTEMG
jgi:hypothetical protein